MTLPCHLADLDGAAVGSVVEVGGDEAHHAVVVRRLREGESVLLTDGRGTRVTGAVAATTKRSFTVAVESLVHEERPRPGFTVVQALPKGERAELAVEVLTEVGVERIVPWAAARSVAVWRGERAARSHAKWQATAREAAKQARRAWHPAVDPMASTDEVVALVGAAGTAVVLHEDATASLADVALPSYDEARPSGDVLVVVGPEGGLTEDEVSAFAAAGAHIVRLGDEVLRTSTAGVVAVGALLARTPRWGA